MNYDKEKVCGWHDAHIGLYTSVIKGLKEARKVKFEGLYHIYDYALKLLLGSDYKPLYDPNNPHDVLDKRFNALKMSGAPGVFNMILNTSPLDAASFVGHTDDLNSLVLYWLVEGDMYETMLGRIITSSKTISFRKSLLDIERRMIQDSVTYCIKDVAFWQELSSSPIQLLLIGKEELAEILKPWVPEIEKKEQETELTEEAPEETVDESYPETPEESVNNNLEAPEELVDESYPEAPEESVDDFNPEVSEESQKEETSTNDAPQSENDKVSHISTLFLSEDIAQNQEDALVLYRFITKNNNSNAIIAAIYQLQKEMKLRDLSPNQIHDLLHSDIDSIKTYSTIIPVYNKYEILKKLTLTKEIGFRFPKEKEKKRALKIFELMTTFSSFQKSATRNDDAISCSPTITEDITPSL